MKGGKMKSKVRALMLFIFLVITAQPGVPTWAGDHPPAINTSAGNGKGESLTELNKKLSNPISELWSISFQQNNYKIVTVPGQEDRWNSNLNFQPVLPVSLTADWNLITRPVITLFNSIPYPSMHENAAIGQPEVDIQRTTTFGDAILMEMLAPSQAVTGNWLLGFGPTFIFPTAGSDYTGQGKWQVGPAAVFGYLSQKWILGVFVQNWTSFAGDSDRQNVNQMNLQPLASYFLPDGWNIGYSGNILANWEADSDEVWTVPIGFGISKVVRFGRFPVKIGLGLQWMPIHPDSFGQQWNVQLSVSPVIPKLIKGTLF
jgi:hypothetical protein